MGWRADQDQDEDRLPDGFECIGRDSDLHVYTYRDRKDGSIWESSPGNQYGRLHKVSRNATRVNDNTIHMMSRTPSKPSRNTTTSKKTIPVRPRVGTASEIEGYDEWHIGQYIIAPFQSLSRAVTSAYTTMQTSSRNKQEHYSQRTRAVSEPSRLIRNITQRRKNRPAWGIDNSNDEKPYVVHYDFVDKRGSRYKPQRFCEFKYDYEDDTDGYTSAEEEEKRAYRREQRRVDRVRDRNIDRRRSTRS